MYRAVLSASQSVTLQPSLPCVKPSRSASLASAFAAAAQFLSIPSVAAITRRTNRPAKKLPGWDALPAASLWAKRPCAQRYKA